MRTALLARLLKTMTCVGALSPAYAFGQALPPEAARSGPPGWTAACDTIAGVEVRGNRRMSKDAVRFDLDIRPGDSWDPNQLRREFSRFWERGYFSDLRFLGRCDPEGAVLVIELEERPTISRITYDKVKAANEQQIEDYFREQDFKLSEGAPLDRKRIFRARSLIKELLAREGYLDARVRAIETEESPSRRSLHFRILPGNKTRIRKIDFVGNEAFPDKKLRKQLELTSQWRWWWPFGKKSLYHQLKYQQDINNVLKYYRDNGYLDVDAKPPVVDIETVRSKKAEKKAQKKLEKEKRKLAKQKESDEPGIEAEEGILPPIVEATPAPVVEPELEIKERKWVYLTVPVVEGPVYRLGEVTFEGNELFTDEQLRLLVPLEKGDVLADAAMEAGLGLIRTAYGNVGFIYAVASRSFDRLDGEPVADVLVTIDEDRAYAVGRIEFRGNTTTQDSVLRRELNIFEGSLISRRQLDTSMAKLRQLGYWVPSQEPALTPDPDVGEVDVLIAGQEQSRNEINVGGGFSELEGGFFFGSYSTSNFLGRGERLSITAAIGGRSDRASLTFVEPWFLDRPITFGFTLFSTNIDFGRTFDAQGNATRLNRNGRGASVTLGKRVGNFSQAQVTFRYEDTESDTQAPLVDPSGNLTNTVTEFQTKLTTVSPAFSYRRLRRGSVLQPRQGLEIVVVPEVTTDLLGGDISFIRPRAEVTWYQPLGRKLFLSLHAEAAWVKAFGDERSREPGFIDGVPIFRRFFIGGDSLGPRVFETRSLSPVRNVVQTDAFGNAIIDPATGLPLRSLSFVGGSKMALIQSELGIPLGQTATLAAFFDVGGSYDNGQDITYEDARVSAGIEFRVFLPVFQAPIRLIYGWPLQENEFDESSSFQFSIGLPF